jgi:hypothetical protein
MSRWIFSSLARSPIIFIILPTYLINISIRFTNNFYMKPLINPAIYVLLLCVIIIIICHFHSNIVSINPNHFVIHSYFTHSYYYCYYNCAMLVSSSTLLIYMTHFIVFSSKSPINHYHVHPLRIVVMQRNVRVCVVCHCLICMFTLFTTHMYTS